MSSLKIDTEKLVQLFMTLDDDDSGSVSVDEFIDGCMRFQGEAKRIDLHVLGHEIKKVEKKIQALLDFHDVKPIAPKAKSRVGIESRLKSVASKMSAMVR